ncbi:MAG: response regulator [Hyphomicrobium sp.]|jgi:DNA-binding NarL/FixJ family response regulator
MAASSTGSGGDFLARKSELMRARGTLRPLKNVLIVEDENLDAERMFATLRVMFGYALEVRRASTLASAIDSVLELKPELIFLDDILKPSDDATQTIPFLRHAGYEGPIIVVSGQATRNRRSVLLAAGAQEVIHKDDVDSVRLTEALERVFKSAPDAT